MLKGHTMDLNVKRLNPDATLPTRAHPGDAGIDLYALEGAPLRHGSIQLIRTGIAVDIPLGYAGFIYARSGLAARYGIRPANCVGVIDHGYTGEILVPLTRDKDHELSYDEGADEWYVRHTPPDWEVTAGHKIAQLVIQRVELPAVVEVDDLDDTERGAGGFGSTGA